MYSRLLLFLHSFPFSSPSSSFTVLPFLAFLPLPLLLQACLLFSPLSSSSSYSSSSFFNPLISCIHQLFFLFCILLLHRFFSSSLFILLRRSLSPTPTLLPSSQLLNNSLVDFTDAVNNRCHSIFSLLLISNVVEVNNPIRLSNVSELEGRAGGVYSVEGRRVLCREVSSV